MGITEGGKVTITDEAFTELQIVNYWDKWGSQGQALWTDARGGNTHYKGWHEDAYKQFSHICIRIKTQREEDSQLFDSREKAFLAYAKEKYGAGGKEANRVHQRADDDLEMFNELDM